MQKDDALNIALGARIKEIRTQKDISQEKLAEMIGVCNGTHLSNVERGYCGLSIPKLVNVCEALDVSADHLLFGTTVHDVETVLHESLNQLTRKQADCLMDIIRAYIKSCDI
ncbi:MAG: helix-turn-helix transcriptional regulator [Clostridia bacterium]|nr:helix-turn-helix transcriptional regulator [Clostridia bacterium]